MRLGLAALWGSTALLVRVASIDVSAGFITGARMSIAAIAMLAYSGFCCSLPSLRARPGQYALMGLLNAALPIGLGAFAATRIPVGVAAILFAPTPLFAAIIAAIWLRERLSPVKIGGILLGLLGVVILIVFGVVSTAIAYLLFFGLFERIGAVRTLMAALLIPCFGVIWGAVFRAEPLTWNVLVGLVIVLASLVLVTGFTFKRE